MTVTLSEILPNISQSLNGTGFLFGAGASFEAGYPLMPGLTRDVMAALTTDEREQVEQIITANGPSYNHVTGTPNIEQISDIIISHWTNSGDPNIGHIENRLRVLILDIILSVSNPNIDTHCQFFNLLKKRAFGLACTIWIFTTNYDILIETAAAQTGVLVENGFCGTTERFFSPTHLNHTYGAISGQKFTPCSNLTVKLIKLHGSISWYEHANLLYESHPSAITMDHRRVMVLPRRRKVLDTLTSPYDSMFSSASRAIGGECKYIASCGFSFADEHINQTLLMPAMQSNKCKLFVLSKEEPPGIADFKSMPNFGAAFESHVLSKGNGPGVGTDLWQFSKFVGMF